MNFLSSMFSACHLYDQLSEAAVMTVHCVPPHNGLPISVKMKYSNSAALRGLQAVQDGCQNSHIAWGMPYPDRHSPQCCCGTAEDRQQLASCNMHLIVPVKGPAPSLLRIKAWFWHTSEQFQRSRPHSIIEACLSCQSSTCVAPASEGVI